MSNKSRFTLSLVPQGGPQEDSSVVVVSETPDEKQDTRLRPMVRAAPGRKGPTAQVRQRTERKQKRSQKKINKSKRPLSNVSAANISLQDAANFLGTAWKYGSMVLGMMNIEEKLLYTAHQDGVINSAQTYFVSAIGQGTDYYQRAGNSIRLSRIRLDYLLTANATAVNNAVRVIFFRDMMCQAANPSYADLLTDSSTTPSLAITSPYQPWLGDRFEVLYDQVHTLSSGAGDAMIHRRIGLGINDHVLYKGTGSTVASAWQGNVFCMVFSDNTTNKPTLTMSSLLEWTDD